VLWVRNRGTWVRFMRRWLSLSLVALVCYVTYPMAPPWMAAQEGLISPAVERITSRGWYDVGEVGLHETVSALTNQVAAMPSLHAAVALFVAVFGVERLRSPWRWLLLLYPAAMGFLLVYDAEHYVVDILAGYTVAGLVMWACSAWERYRPGSDVSVASRRQRSLRS
jgi:membrane-associated phospholipid phosphatase